MKAAPLEVPPTFPCPHPAQNKEKWKSLKILTVRKKKPPIHLTQLLYINYHNMKHSALSIQISKNKKESIHFCLLPSNT